MTNTPTTARHGKKKALIEQDTTNRLTCPGCGGELRNIVDSRPTFIGATDQPVIRRARRCMKCGERHATIEVSEAFLQTYRKQFLKEIAIKIISGEIG